MKEKEQRAWLVQSKLMEWVRENYQPQTILSATPKQVGIDSIGLIELVMWLEQELEVEIPDEWLVEGLDEKPFSELATMLANKLEEA